MRRRRLGRSCPGWVALALALATLAPLPPATAQRPALRAFQGAIMPRFDPQGQWGQVVTATSKWLVIQNDQGQQFPVPISPATTGLFVIRWPVTPDRITPNAVAEVTGVQVGSNQVQAGHADIFETDAQNLLGGGWPSVTTIGGFGRVLTPYSVDPNNAYRGYDFVYPLPGENMLPIREHIVAPVASGQPLMLSIGRNRLATVLPGPAGLNLTRVTDGSPSFVTPGDLVYYLPTQATQRGLTLAQLVVYKRMPLDQFVAP